MNITSIEFHRFKKFDDATISLKPGVSLLAGGNNSGKTTILQGLAIWEFCRTVLETERGKKALCAGASNQGVGLGDDEFTPVNLPSLKHLWTNLRTQKGAEADAYSLWIQVNWNADGNNHHLKIGLSLVNDRLFVKALGSSVTEIDAIPRVAYVPSFAGIVPKEPRHTTAMIRRYVGEGLPGAVLRNVILNLYLENERKRKEEKENSGGKKLKNSFLRQLRKEDPFEVLQALLQDVFFRGIKVKVFSEIYHTNITIEIFKGEVRKNRFMRLKDYTPRDLMVEGSGFLQWLTVLSLTLDPHIQLVLLDEPDAHLHPALQNELLSQLCALAKDFSKQIIFSTHSSELIKHQAHDMVIDANRSQPKYLSLIEQKVSLIAGLGSEYTPRIAALEHSRRVLFVENESDASIIKILSKILGKPLPETFVVWPWASGHKERKYLFLELRRDFPDLVALSIVDRDLSAIKSVNLDLHDKEYPDSANNTFYARKWRRKHLEGYLLHPNAIGRCANVFPEVVSKHVLNYFLIDISGGIVDQTEPEALLQANGKAIISGERECITRKYKINKYDIAKQMKEQEISVDIKKVIDEILEKLVSG